MARIVRLVTLVRLVRLVRMVRLVRLVIQVRLEWERERVGDKEGGGGRIDQ